MVSGFPSVREQHAILGGVAGEIIGDLPDDLGGDLTHLADALDFALVFGHHGLQEDRSACFAHQRQPGQGFLQRGKEGEADAGVEPAIQAHAPGVNTQVIEHHLVARRRRRRSGRHRRL